MKTLAHEFLDIERECGFEVPQSCYNTLDSLLAKAQRIDTSQEPRAVLRSIGRFLEDEGYKPMSNGLFSHSLQSRDLCCKNSSVLYYSIAEMLGFSDKLSIVLGPRHAFVRYNDGKLRFNWETTANKETDDNDYISQLHIHQSSIEQKVYLSDLTREQAKAIAFDTCGCLKFGEKEYERAIGALNKAIKLNPKHARAYCYRGNIFSKKRQYLDACTNLSESIKLDPNYARPYYYRGCLQIKLKHYERAVADLDKAIELDPNHSSSYYYRGKAKLMLGKIQEGMKDIETYNRLRENEA